MEIQRPAISVVPAGLAFPVPEYLLLAQSLKFITFPSNVADQFVAHMAFQASSCLAVPVFKLYQGLGFQCGTRIDAELFPSFYHRIVFRR